MHLWRKQADFQQIESLTIKLPMKVRIPFTYVIGNRAKHLTSDGPDAVPVSSPLFLRNPPLELNERGVQLLGNFLHKAEDFSGNFVI